MDAAPESTPPQTVSEPASTIMALADALAKAAVVLDPQGKTAYIGTPPQSEQTLANTWRETLLKWARQGVISRTTYVEATEPLRVWYVASHQFIVASRYYVDSHGSLYGSFLRHPVNGVVEVIPLTLDLLEMMPNDDAQHLISKMRQQRAYQRLYLGDKDPTPPPEKIDSL